MSIDQISVQVALRIRPLIDNEIKRGCKRCLLAVTTENQVQVIGTDKAFTYNFVFDEASAQEDVYKNSVKEMLLKLFKGYNVTILAYGQTGSGKTHSMGTSYDGTGDMGVIPRAIEDIFIYIKNNSSDHEYRVTVSFMELYQETLYDLLSHKPRDQCTVDIREDTKGIKIPGLSEIEVSDINETIQCLFNGSAGRATGATAMNAQSSRSHAIFTINIYMQKKNDPSSATTAKFHLVDLAGSERSKKTKATGERFKEGININKGLLALGNVISALGEAEGKGYISYRDSKLTRFLQDSLGGNSVTLMIACVSPADYNLEETLSTLRYADRARKIKNKPIINQDPKSAEIARLNQIIQQLQADQISNGTISMNSEQIMELKVENLRLQNRNRELNNALVVALAENTSMIERVMLIKAANESLQKKISELKDYFVVTLHEIKSILVNELNGEIKINVLNDHMKKLESMNDMITRIQNEQKKNEDEIQIHEYKSEHVSQGSINHDLYNGQPEIDEEQEKFTQEQLNLNNELIELSRVLAIKEQLASKLEATTKYMSDSQAMQENEIKISNLEKEKDELLNQLKSAQSNTACSKLAEQRRLRVKDLELQISELNKKVTEQARMLKIKESNDRKIKSLNMEIQAMKAAKVKLIKTMRSEEQRFREWKAQREKELIRLKDQDRKRQYQLIRMENMHQKQQTVLKRKVEEAAAINKRLKDALSLQRQTQDRRNLQPGGRQERIEQWIEQEFEIMISTIEAQQSLKQLIEDRAILNQELSRLKENLDFMDEEKGRKQLVQLNNDIELRSTQIAELNQKIIDSDQENKSKIRWDIIQTVGEAKFALNKIFNLTVNLHQKAVINEYKLEELKYSHEEAQNKITACENMMKEQSLEHNKKIIEHQAEVETKMLAILKQLHDDPINTNDENMKERLKIQEEQINELNELRTELEQYKQEIQTLKEKLEQANQSKKKSKETKKSSSPQNYKTELSFHTSFEDCNDDSDTDPDWKKTPLYKRVLAAMPDRGQKRSSNGNTKCSCKGRCDTKTCGCQKKNVYCSENCNCPVENCKNKENKVSKNFFGNEENEDSFQKPLLFGNYNEDTVAKKRPKKSYFGTLTPKNN